VSAWQGGGIATPPPSEVLRSNPAGSIAAVVLWDMAG
jgi:hypothetical protein